MDNSSPRNARTVVVGGGTMGADVAVVLARGGAQVTVVDPHAARRDHVLPHIAQELAAAGQATHAGPVQVCASLQDVDWSGVVLVVECITEQLAAKQKLFAELEAVAPLNAVLASNSSGFPISAIAHGLATAQRMLGLHFFMPAHLVPLVEVVLGERSDPALGTWLHAFMRGCGSVPVLVKKDSRAFWPTACNTPCRARRLRLSTKALPPPRTWTPPCALVLASAFWRPGRCCSATTRVSRCIPLPQPPCTPRCRTPTYPPRPCATRWPRAPWA